MPQPAASRALRSLSERLGGPVTAQVGRGIRLTDATRALVPFARIALRAVEDGLTAWDAQTERAASTVRLAFQTSLGSRIVPELIRDVRSSHPDIRFELHQGSRGMCAAMFEDGLVDIAVVSDYEAAAAGIDVHLLFTQRLIAIVPDSSPLAGRASIRADALLDDDLVALKPEYGLRRSVDELFAVYGRRPSIAFEGQDVTIVGGLVAAGVGVSIVPEGTDLPDGCSPIALEDAGAIRRMVALSRPAVAAPWARLVGDSLEAAVSRVGVGEPARRG